MVTTQYFNTRVRKCSVKYRMSDIWFSVTTNDSDEKGRSDTRPPANHLEHNQPFGIDIKVTFYR